MIASRCPPTTVWATLLHAAPSAVSGPHRIVLQLLIRRQDAGHRLLGTGMCGQHRCPFCIACGGPTGEDGVHAALFGSQRGADLGGLIGAEAKFGGHPCDAFIDGRRPHVAIRAGPSPVCGRWRALLGLGHNWLHECGAEGSAGKQECTTV